MQRGRDEEDFSAEQPTEGQEPRVSSPYGYSSRKGYPPRAPSEGPSALGGLRPSPCRVSTKEAFRELRISQLRARGSAIGIAKVPGTGCTQVGFAISRHVGNAVTRNRIRRRLRAITRDEEVAMSQGTYLITAQRRAATLPYSALKRDLLKTLARLEAIASHGD